MTRLRKRLHIFRNRCLVRAYTVQNASHQDLGPQIAGSIGFTLHLQGGICRQGNFTFLGVETICTETCVVSIIDQDCLL